MTDKYINRTLMIFLCLPFTGDPACSPGYKNTSDFCYSGEFMHYVHLHFSRSSFWSYFRDPDLYWAPLQMLCLWIFWWLWDPLFVKIRNKTLTNVGVRTATWELKCTVSRLNEKPWFTSCLRPCTGLLIELICLYFSYFRVHLQSVSTEPR